MIKACEKASKILIRDFGELEKLQVSKKGPRDFVTNSDVKAEKIIIEELKKARPNYSIISEENGIENNKDVTLLASSPITKYQIFKYQNHAYGIQFHIEIKDTTVNEWGCVPEYKKALEDQLGNGALEKFDQSAKDNMKDMNNYSTILYNNFKKLL